MSKKKDKKAKKAAKPTKSAPKKGKAAARPKAGKPAKAAKKIKAKPASKSRPVAKKAAKKAPKKIVKKVSKPAKAKLSKPVKKKTPARPAKPLRPAKALKKVLKPIKKAKAAPKKSLPAAKLKKPITLVKTLKGKGGKTAKPAPKAAPKTIAKAAPAKAASKPLSAKASQEKISSIKEKPLKPRGKGGRKPKNKGDDDEPEIIHDELIEQIIQTTRRQAKQPKAPKIIKTFVNPHESLALALPDASAKKGSIPKKEPKGKFELEYVVRTSPGILFELLTTPSGLSEWFADDVNIRDGIFTFFWDGSEQKARLLGFKEEKYLRLQWMDKPEGYYFEFRIEKDELTGDISLMIVDFADEASDQQTSKLLWDSQVNKLLNVLGSN